MGKIELLTRETIDKIAAGEVVERPKSVVKELVENAIDAGATAITIEIKEGGISLIRITDNGSGIKKSDVPIAFLRHSTSKIKTAEDLLSVSSLGFRGEALSSISAIARVELITKTYDDLTGTRYLIEGSKEISNTEIGAPDGTTFIVKDIFFNTPARRKFLKSPTTEGNYITDVVEKLALSHPNISFKFINNNKIKLHTSGNSNIKDLVYQIYGREIANSLIEVDVETELFKVHGFLGKPIITRGNRNYENYFINGRYIKSSLLSKSIEDGYKNYLMQHQYPFTLLYFDFKGSMIDVNVHPTKMELRFSHNEEIYSQLYDIVYAKLSNRELIPRVPIDENDQKDAALEKQKILEKAIIPEPFETFNYAKEYEKFIKNNKKTTADESNDTKQQSNANSFDKFHSKQVSDAVSTISNALNMAFNRKNFDSNDVDHNISNTTQNTLASNVKDDISNDNNHLSKDETVAKMVAEEKVEYKEITLSDVDENFLSQKNKSSYNIIGQLFKTYWLIEFGDELYIMDQHAAHEKVLYEQTLNKLKNKEFTSQVLNPPIILTLDDTEQEMLSKIEDELMSFGYDIEYFGGKEYKITAVPDNLYNIDMKTLFIDMIDECLEFKGKTTSDLILHKVATMSCKAAIKGNNKISELEVRKLLDDLLKIENPYNCPHGRPTIIAMTKYEIEKKFKRIV
ncbi:DNA mismatch repair endonuclease MutL [Lachnobacterium bovis]|uniref:DNA mismatch repair protein MutL n=1 Tax=Lachnobacterium bovis TaxID=140626 RepID=A0A1H9PZF7_9FIRM|nr:DNA mismatch repair endonuclease MutL [Lachnobacterium bovis]SER53540.1 DNA mismatch repair protein MutL [Lachnobacterium bovis]